MTTIDLTLDRVQRLFSYFSYTRPTCHIAGTNGKGSVSALLTSILRASSPPLSVGRYNSPHLISIYDCIVINDHQVNVDVYDSTRADIEKVDHEHAIGASSFELLTVTALVIFERAQLDVVVVEVGMGGRLDATNIIPDECIVVSALTAVDLDHQAFLGHTVTEIAVEKAGIARRGKPFILGVQKHSEVSRVVADVVAMVGGEVLQSSKVTKRAWDGEIDGSAFSGPALLQSNFQPLPQPVKISMSCFEKDLFPLLPLFGDHQLDNLGTATAVVSTLLTHPSSRHLALLTRISPDTVLRGVHNTKWPGRLSFHVTPPPHSGADRLSKPLTVLVDGAHNPASADTLSTYINHLISAAIRNTNTSSHSQFRDRTLSLTYILALSHSPPKTPLQTLSRLLLPILDCNVNVNIRIALLRFTPPVGMSWVKSVAPSELRNVVCKLIPDAGIWTATDDEAVDEQLERALEWAGDNQTACSSDDQLVVVAGSLYLVGDFYRYLRKEK